MQIVVKVFPTRDVSTNTTVRDAVQLPPMPLGSKPASTKVSKRPSFPFLAWNADRDMTKLWNLTISREAGISSQDVVFAVLSGGGLSERLDWWTMDHLSGAHRSFESFLADSADKGAVLAV